MRYDMKLYFNMYCSLYSTASHFTLAGCFVEYDKQVKEILQTGNQGHTYY